MLQFSTTTVPPATVQLIATYITPLRGHALSAQLVGITCYANADAEYYVYKNGRQMIGGRTSGAEPTLQLNFSDAPEGLIGGDIILVYASTAEDDPEPLNCTLRIDLL